jgi:hypothetical protein
MRRVRVLKPIQSVEEVQASLDTFGGRIAARLDGRRPPAVDDDAPNAAFSYQEVFDDLGSDLESLRLRVVGADDEHVRRLAWAATVRRRRDELGTELYDQLVAARRILSGAFDPEQTFEVAAMSGLTPRNLKPLEEQVDQTVKLLRQPVVEEPKVKVFGVDVQLGKVADGFEAMLKELRTKRSELDRARKAVGESKVLLDQVLAEFQGSFPWIAQALEAFARMAGERELADRIRTSIRRVTRRQGESEEETDEAASDEAVSDQTAPGTDPASDAEAAAEASSSDPASVAIDS